MSYTKVAIRDAAAHLLLQDGDARQGSGKLQVLGTLEPGATLDKGTKYKITGEVGLDLKLPYVGSPGAGKYDFKID